MGGFLGSLTGANAANAAAQAAKAQAAANQQAAQVQVDAYGKAAPLQANAATQAAQALQDAYGSGTKSLVGGYNNANDTLNSGYQSALGFLQPYAAAGTTATGQLNQGLTDGSLTRSFGAGDFTADPGYQFRLDQGMNGIQQSAAAGGGLMSGATLKALQNNNSNLASQEYGNAYNRYSNDQQNRFNRLFGVAQSGQGLAQNMGNMAYQNASNIANNQIGIGNAQNAGTLGAAQANANGITGAAGYNAQGILGAAGAQADGILGAGNAISAGTIAGANNRSQAFANLANLAGQAAGAYASGGTSLAMPSGGNKSSLSSYFSNLWGGNNGQNAVTPGSLNIATPNLAT
ncbi:hypothetical protein [Aquirhabdus parva]|uniref:DNA transfer protein n=1 Tax=Aquirhabdus parva TaxID=2283318 RepID=A0A345PAR8_9GAMM|nr:hypothetical protein [Aquirhabdus parva]AXI01431.1 hypothetical protein HYN46_00050 [Aquirhabdus parva]AXI04377.1 hypothetical protein HYN46_16965 [Aquirhabdus parva]